MKTRNLIIEGTADEVVEWKAWLERRIEDPKADRAAVRLLRQLQRVRDGGLVEGAPPLELPPPEKPKAQGQRSAPDPQAPGEKPQPGTSPAAQAPGDKAPGTAPAAQAPGQ